MNEITHCLLCHLNFVPGSFLSHINALHPEAWEGVTGTPCKPDCEPMRIDRIPFVGMKAIQNHGRRG